MINSGAVWSAMAYQRAPTLHLSNRVPKLRNPALPETTPVNIRPAMPGPANNAGTAYGIATCNCWGVAENPPEPSPTAIRMMPHEMANASTK